MLLNAILFIIAKTVNTQMSLNRRVVEDILVHPQWSTMQLRTEWGTYLFGGIEWSPGYIVKWKKQSGESVYGVLPFS